MQSIFIRQDDVIEDYHGTKVADPYRWLEEAISAETQAWVEAQNVVTRDYLFHLFGMGLQEQKR